jgi:hypothetical protein
VQLPEAGIRLTCRQVSPVIPNDYKDSSLPVRRALSLGFGTVAWLTECLWWAPTDVGLCVDGGE